MGRRLLIYYQTENTTYGLDLSSDWTISSMKLVQTVRPSDSTSLRSASLWYDEKHNSIYCFGGDASLATPALANLPSPPESIWAFNVTGEGSANWYEVLGPTSSMPFPSNIHRVSCGTSTYDGSNAYYLGGYGAKETSQFFPAQSPRNWSSGLLKFDFATLSLTNSSDGGYLAPHVPGTVEFPAGAMINIPRYDDNDLLLIMPSGRDRLDFAFNNVTLYDKKNDQWYFQATSGDKIPESRSHFCAIGVGEKNSSSFEM